MLLAARYCFWEKKKLQGVKQQQQQQQQQQEQRY